MRAVAVLCATVATGWTIQAADAADLPPMAPRGPASDWVPMFGDFLGVRIDGPLNVYRGGIKIQENESPRPVDRVYFNYNYFSDVNRTTANPFNLHRETFGFEKTFLNGDASFGARLPFTQVSNQDGTNTGDVSLIGKYALINQPGAVLSVGLAVSLPTGSQIQAFDLDTNQPFRSTVLQPFVGGFYSITPDLFVQGISSIAIPTDSRDVTMLYNSIGAGYWVYRGTPNTVVTGVIPIVEFHFNTPLDHRNDGQPDPLKSTVNFTGGVQIELFNRARLGFAAGVPLTGPRPYDLEFISSFNLRF